jgi:hypothetical protein
MVVSLWNVNLPGYGHYSWVNRLPFIWVLGRFSGSDLSNVAKAWVHATFPANWQTLREITLHPIILMNQWRNLKQHHTKVPKPKTLSEPCYPKICSPENRPAALVLMHFLEGITALRNPPGPAKINPWSHVNQQVCPEFLVISQDFCNGHLHQRFTQAERDLLSSWTQLARGVIGNGKCRDIAAPDTNWVS